MKLIGYILFLFLNQLLPAQSVKGVLQALAQQDQTFLNQNFSSEVHYSLDLQSYEGSKIEAIQSVLNFVGSSSGKNFKIIHEGVPKGKESFMGIGNLVSDKGKFRVYITFHFKDNKYLVNELKIEKDGL